MQLKCYPKKEDFLKLARDGNVIPVCLEILADTETPVSLLMKKSPLRPAFLLESAEGGERWGRYSFLGTSAYARITVFARDVTVTGPDRDQRIPHHGDPLSVLRGILKSFVPVHLPDLPRFWGGMIGYLEYEMVSFFEQIPCNTPEDHVLAHFIITDELYIFDTVRHTLTLVAHVFLESNTDPASAFDIAQKRLKSMHASVSADPADPPLPSADPAVPREPDPGVFMDAVRKTQAYIRAGDIIQAVISRSCTRTAPVDAVRLYRALRYINPSPYLFYLAVDPITLIGSSPETMVRLEKGYDGFDLLKATFPAGTLSGAPKVRAMEIISELETEPRGPYGGAVGYISFSGNMDLAITIRTASVTNGQLTIRTGAGIVADSDPASEYTETVIKSRAMERAIALASQGAPSVQETDDDPYDR